MDNKLHNKAFGILIYQENICSIFGFLVNRKVPELMKEGPLYEVCNWVKLNITNDVNLTK
jgi:hypothetical protein